MLLAQQDSIRVADSIKRAINRQKAIEEARLDSLIRAEQEKAAYEASMKKFNIVVGSFITPEYAHAGVDEYRKMGYDPQIIHPADSRFDLVVAESHEYYSPAVRRIEQFRDTVEIDAWLYVRR
jgi:2-methylisocitrate lyase-like PEP mutase family enzyme